ncbi:uncharacterized protein GGS22DRAFT_112987 [Annulohypoxylon maeteangense]|uniref:uncharacterized protein n=1 Tax=Annulohypoxylon maeteangense TaxID=1927788 RepID=UPI002008B356|nr:uncharacterized protein GGS22DRAFT_112987 [Annulohypoxylon maeteangense]KAI0887677.1 hypothetical protein GGS22DRAFT_112987 [Annulohypoxylon maeteangense]
MVVMPRKKKQHQTRLTFEPIDVFESPNRASPANVRFTKSVAASGSSSRASSQQATLAPSRSGSSQKSPLSSMTLPKAGFMTKSRGFKHPTINTDSANDSVGEFEEEEDAFPESSQSISTMLRQTGFKAEDATIAYNGNDDHDIDHGDDGDDDDDDDEPIIPPSTRKRARPKFIELEDSSDEATSPAKRSKTSQVIPDRIKKSASSASSSTKRPPLKGHRTEKQKKIELLRRRRAGEKIDRVTSSEDSEEEKRGIYDSDSEDEFGVLKEFDDEEESDKEQVEAPIQIRKSTKKHMKDSPKGSEDEEDDGDLDDFVVDDDDAPFGAPATLDIPLEFTAQAHRPLKEQFPYVIEWLVRNRIDPAFDRNDPVYANAWRKLNDEVQGLASSKFASSAWRPEFHRALKVRPNVLSLPMGPAERRLYDVCEACGRGDRQPTRVITFSGHPYYKDTLSEIESDSDENEGDTSDNGSIDSQGMALPAVTKKWHVGIVCCTNAETAHSLIHWKHALKEWVEERLQLEGWMNADKLEERERMRGGKRLKLANKIIDGWREEKIVKSLYRDFKTTLEDARKKSTGRHRHRNPWGL